MKQENKNPDFLGTYTIVCPTCKVKQTGILKLTRDEHAPYIKCCMLQCEHIIHGDALEEVTRLQVKGPSDLNRW